MTTIMRRMSVFFVAFGAMITTTVSAFAQAIEIEQYDDEQNFSSVFERIVTSFEGAPGLISAAAYATGLMLAVATILKLKDHFDDPRSTSIREAIARGLIAGALFAMPTVMEAVMYTMGGPGGNVGVTPLTKGGLGDLGGAFSNLIGANACDVDRATGVINSGLSGLASGGLLGGLSNAVGSYLNGGTLGQMVCYISHSFSGLPGLLSSLLYISGLFLVFWGLLLLRDHLIAPDKAPISAALKRLLLAGAFFSFQTIAETVQNTVGDDESLIALDPFLTASCGAGTTGNVLGILNTVINFFTESGGGSSGGATGGGLDCMMVRLVSDLWSPVQMAVSIFAYVAGLILIAVALRRILDGLDKGVKSPVGIGTISMILTGGALLAFDSVIKVITVSLFPDFFSTIGGAKLALYGSLSYMPGIGEEGAASINTIITTVFAFSFLVGIISVLRGLFILKEVANGGNASLMAGFTHVIGGGMAMNLGPVVKAVQNTLGLSDVGIKVGTAVPGIF